MLFKKLLSVGLISLLLLNPVNTHAASVLKDENASKEKVPESEIAELENDLGANFTPHSSDSNEPNNTIKTAFSYRDAFKISCSELGHLSLGHYNCFYTPNIVSDVDDLDYYKLTLQKGMYYVAVLKNVYISQIRDIRLYYQKSDGSWWYLYPTTKKNGQSLFHFTAEYNTYYVRISGDYAPGKTDFDTNVNWFAVERDGTIDERLLPYDSKPSHALQ